MANNADGGGGQYERRSGHGMPYKERGARAFIEEISREFQGRWMGERLIDLLRVIWIMGAVRVSIFSRLPGGDFPFFLLRGRTY